jgi:BA14K-like protein
MSSRNLFASILMACLPAVGLAGLASGANAAPTGKFFLTPGESARNNVIETKYRDRGHVIYLPVGPSYLYYDYPYYYSRGYYPTHVGPHYIYYGPGHAYYGSFYGRDYDDTDYEGVPYSAKERCAHRFRSFEWDTGLYTTYGGRRKLCPYLR